MGVAGETPFVYDPPYLFPVSHGTFTVISSPCTMAEIDGHACVGWPVGYIGSEQCAIVAPQGGILGPCVMFDTQADDDYLMLLGMVQYSGAERTDCPAGAHLSPGAQLGWSSSATQGDRGNGLPYSHADLGGGWHVCFA
jgi:hypothetical protein